MVPIGNSGTLKQSGQLQDAMFCVMLWCAWACMGECKCLVTLGFESHRRLVQTGSGGMEANIVMSWRVEAVPYI